MGYPAQPPWPPAPPPWPPAPPPRNAADVTGSVVAMVVTVLIVCFGAVMGFLSLAFLDHCPPATCSVGGAVTASMTTVGIAGLTAVAGIITTIVRLVNRKVSWPFAVGTLALCVAIFFFGAIAFQAAVS